MSTRASNASVGDEKAVDQTGREEETSGGRKGDGERNDLAGGRSGRYMVTGGIRGRLRKDGWCSAWAVWLRVDQWPTALGKHLRLRCGVLYHIANRTLSFHGILDAVQLLLPVCESWTYASLPKLPSVGQTVLQPLLWLTHGRQSFVSVEVVPLSLPLDTVRQLPCLKL